MDEKSPLQPSQERAEKVRKFKSLLRQLKSIKPQVLKEEMLKNPGFQARPPYVDELIDLLEPAQKKCDGILQFPFELILSSNLNIDAFNSSLTEIMDKLGNITTIGAYDLVLRFKALAYDLLQASAIGEYEVFSSAPRMDIEQRSALAHYIKTAQEIRSQKASFDASVFGLLERMLLNKQRVCEELFHEIFAQMPFSTASCFFALAAPSLEGKTQSAFVLDAVKPLYFPLCKPYEANARASQPIYHNYSTLSDSLAECASKDLKSLKKKLKDENIVLDAMNGEKITDSRLLSRFPLLPFWTLGFLKVLAERLKKMSSDRPSTPWMELLADSLDFSYAPLSLDQVRNAKSDEGEPVNYFEGLCIFLDEFVSDDWAVLIRNLCRTINFNCLVANTNAKVANVVGKETVSGGKGTLVWSVVFSKLSSADFNIDSVTKKTLESLVGRIIDHRKWKSDEQDPVALFLFQISANLTRPGVGEHFVAALDRFVDSQLRDLAADFPVTTLADFIFRDVAIRLVERKSALGKSMNGKLGTLGLLHEESFIDADVSYTPTTEVTTKKADEERKKRLCNHRGYLTDHFYYLSNPQGADSNGLFLTFPAEHSNRSDEPHLDVFFKSSDAKWDSYSWLLEFTHFNHKDIFTLLACFFVRFEDSMARFLAECKTFLDFKSLSYFNAPNTKLKSHNSGNEMVICVSSILTESSRHPHILDTDYTLAGQNGVDFVKNIIRHCIVAGLRDRTIVRAEVVIPAELNAILEACMIPFIYGLDREIEFLNMLTGLTATGAQPLFAASLRRCLNSDQVDLEFPIKYRGQLTICICECKHYQASLTTPTLCTVIEKGLMRGQSLNLVFCKSAILKTRRSSKNPKLSDKNDLTGLCKSNNVNIYRVLRTSLKQMSFDIIPFDDDFPHHPPEKNPITFLLFEIDRITFLK